MASVVMYHLLKNPATLSALQKEIDTAAREGRISKVVTWKESQTLPYLDACVKEASRLHPPIGFPMERIVPESGLEVDGYFIPPGTRVSMVRVMSRLLLVLELMLIRNRIEPLGSSSGSRAIWGRSRHLATRAVAVWRGKEESDVQLTSNGRCPAPLQSLERS